MKECGKLSDESGTAREAARRGRKDYGRGTGLAPEQAQDEAEHPYRMGYAAA
ncbi:hypothetical protein NXY31_21030 [Bacteroides salyersiae]|nr:hypothetical protein [Bacteroides salyersiae]